VELNSFVGSVDKQDLQVVVRELGTMFHGTGRPLQQLLDNGSTFVDEASAHTAETRALLDDGLTVLQTQEGQGENIRSFSHDLAAITRSLKESDQDLRTTLSDTPATAREIDALLTDLEPTLPVLLGNATSVSLKVNAKGDRWTYVDPAGSHAGIRGVVVRDRSVADGELEGSDVGVEGDGVLRITLFIRGRLFGAH